MIYLVQEFIMGKWNATIKACKHLCDASSAVEQIMKDEELEQKDFFMEGNPIYPQYWVITDGEKTFMIQTIKLIKS